MYVEKIEKGFTNLIRIGVYSNFVYLLITGIYMSVDELFEQCQHFNNVVLLGEEPLLQKEEVGKLFKKLVKNNSNIHLELHINGMYKPIDLSAFKDNITFYVYVPLRNIGLRWEERINENNLSWYSDVHTNFIFKVKDLDDIEEVTTLTQSFGIKKSQTFIIPLDNVDKIKEHIKFYGFNISFEVDW
jgi:organic radical activating enzyme